MRKEKSDSRASRIARGMVTRVQSTFALQDPLRYSSQRFTRSLTAKALTGRATKMRSTSCACCGVRRRKTLSRGSGIFLPISVR